MGVFVPQYELWLQLRRGLYPNRFFVEKRDIRGVSVDGVESDVVAKVEADKIVGGCQRSYGSDGVRVSYLIHRGREEERMKQAFASGIPYSGPVHLEGRIPGELPVGGC